MQSKILLFTFMGLMLASPLALADTIKGSDGGAWTAIPTPDQNGDQFWDNPSKDSTPPGNLGQVLQVAGAALARHQKLT